MKSKGLIGAGILIAVALVGCGSSAPSDMTQQEVEALKHPSKTIPKEAVEGMKHMGEMIQKQKEENDKKGIDAQGLPIKKKPAPDANSPSN